MTKRAQNRRPPLAAVPSAAPAPESNIVQMRQDDYASAILGARAMMTQFSGIGGLSAMLRYSTGGLYARAVDLPADRATDRGVIIEGDADGEVQAEFDRLGVMPALADCLRWAQVDGGAAIVLLAEDGGGLTDELSEDGLSKIVELRVYPGTAFSPEPERYNDPANPKFGSPIKYRVNADGYTFVVHESRIVPVSGGPLPSSVRKSNIPWMGRDEVTRGYKAICRYEQSLDYSQNILQRKQQAVYAMQGMADLLKNPAFNGDTKAGERVVQARIAAVDSVRGTLNTVAVDGNDSYTIIDNNLSGIKDTIGEMKVAVSTEFGIPVTILFEESPGGMNSTGESDFKGWHEKVQGLQKRLKRPLERLVSLILLQDDVTALEDWKIIFPPVDSPTESQLADVENKRAATRKTDMEALQIGIESGIISQQEAAEHIQDQGIYELRGLDRNANRGAAVKYAQQT